MLFAVVHVRLKVDLATQLQATATNYHYLDFQKEVEEEEEKEEEEEDQETHREAASQDHRQEGHQDHHQEEGRVDPLCSPLLSSVPVSRQGG
jgi:hypothetical protein